MVAKKNRQLPRHSMSQLRVENRACHFGLLIMNRTRGTNETSSRMVSGPERSTTQGRGTAF
jgi:hypothetical protein